MAAEDSSLPHPTITDPNEADADPWIGQTVSSYQLIRRIGWGGMGVVYLAQHPNLERHAAVKFLAAHLVVDKTYIDMFMREAKAAAKLNHPNIIAIYDCGSIGEEVYYLIMEYVEGKDLRTILREKLVLPIPDAVHYVRQVAAGLGYAHRKKVIHRDIKPENLMLTTEGVIKIGDLGLAKWMGDESAALTQSGMVMGSPFYIAPERLRGEPEINETTDIYSLGGTFFHLLTGKSPYDGTAPVVMAKHLGSPVPDPHELNPAIDMRLSAIVRKMMAKDQKDRYQNMQELDADLADYEGTLSHPVMRALPGSMESSGGMTIPEGIQRSPSQARDLSVVSEDDIPTIKIKHAERTTNMWKWVACIAAGVAIGLIWYSVSSTRSEFPKPAISRTPSVKTAPAVPAPEPREPMAALTQPQPATPAPSPSPSAQPPAAGAANAVLLYDFEEGPEKWKIDWGFNMGGPTLSPDTAHKGTKSIAFRHYFKKDEESAAGYISFPQSRDFSKYKELSMWVSLPESRSQWTLQVYVRSGKDLTTTWGKMNKVWLGGWHPVNFDLSSADDPTRIKEIGVQVKNFSETKTTIYIDQVELIAK